MTGIGAAAQMGERIAGKYDTIALVLQGGGALGAYQAGVYEALHGAGIAPDWVAGISIGAINAALIAGNPEDKRVERLRQFWERVTTPTLGLFDGKPLAPFLGTGLTMRNWLNQVSAAEAVLKGTPGFFDPRWPPAPLQPSGSKEALSYYDTAPLRETLTELVDFDRINARLTRLSVGAVNIRTGNFAYFDNANLKITAEHIMASGALPPGFTPIKIDGESYWDGGLVSNTPLNYIVEAEPRLLSLVFQVDLWSALGSYPMDLGDVAERQKDIAYSSRTRLNTDVFAYVQMMRCQIRGLLQKLPETLRDTPEAKALHDMAERASMNIIHLIYRKKSHETYSKDYNFSRASMSEHWTAGYHDTVRTLRHPDWLDPPTPEMGVRTHDIHRHGRD